MTLKSDCTLRLGWVVNGNEDYGSAASMEEIGDRLLERGGQPFAFALDCGPFIERVARQSWEVIDLKSPDQAAAMSRRPQGRIDAARRATRLVKLERALGEHVIRHSIDVIVTRSGGLLPLAGAAARRAEVPSFWYMAGSIPNGLHGILSRFYYRRVRKKYNISVIGNSRYTLGTVGTLSGDEIVVPVPISLAPFLDTDKPKNGEGVRTKYPANFLISARLVPMKGQLEFLRAFRRVHDSGEAMRLVLAGDGDKEYESELKREAETIGGPQSVVFLGKRNDVPALMNSADVVVSPSIKPESFGRVCVEAQAAGRPVLATALGGPAETVTDGVTGWLISGGSVSKMEGGIRRALGDRRRWGEMGIAGRERALRHYRGDILADQLIDHVTAHSGT